jgi:type IV secretory pathway VirB4 component
LAEDKLDVKTPMNSGPLSSFFPFVSEDLTSDSGIMYGINRHNNGLVIFDRFSLENANQVVFAKSGGGKSYATKLEIIRQLMMGVDIIVIDPENEYQRLADAFGGSFFNISLTSKEQINPFDIPVIPEGEQPEEVLRSHIVNLSGLLKLMLGQLTPDEDALLDHALTETYASREIVPGEDFADKEPPLLTDLATVMRNLEGGRGMAERLYKYTEGSFAGFINQPTNIDIANRLIIFSIRDLEEELRPIAMYVVLNFIWNLIRAKLKKRILIVDEAWIMMKNEDSATFLFGLVKRARKYYLGVSTITQDVEDFLRSPFGRPIITNSSLQLLLKQAPATIDIVTKAFTLTEAEKAMLLSAEVGTGLFFAGKRHVAIQIIPSYFENQIITTNPQELLGNAADAAAGAADSRANDGGPATKDGGGTTI